MTAKEKNQFVPQFRKENLPTTNMRALGVVFLSVLLAGVGQLIFKGALNDIGPLSLSIEMFISLATSPLLLLGLIVYAASALLWLIALMQAELSFAYPFLSLSYVIVLLGGGLLFNEQVTQGRLLGFAIIIVGIFIVASGEMQKSKDP